MSFINVIKVKIYDKRMVQSKLSSSACLLSKSTRGPFLMARGLNLECVYNEHVVFASF